LALLRKMACNLRHPMGLCHPVQRHGCMRRQFLFGEICVIEEHSERRYFTNIYMCLWWYMYTYVCGYSYIYIHMQIHGRMRKQFPFDQIYVIEAEQPNDPAKVCVFIHHICVWIYSYLCIKIYTCICMCLFVSACNACIYDM